MIDFFALGAELKLGETFTEDQKAQLVEALSQGNPFGEGATAAEIIIKHVSSVAAREFREREELHLQNFLSRSRELLPDLLAKVVETLTQNEIKRSRTLLEKRTTHYRRMFPKLSKDFPMNK